MKHRIIKALLIFSCVGLPACKSEDIPTDNVGQVVSVFELKYGETPTIVVDNQKYIFSLKKVFDNVFCIGETVEYSDFNEVQNLRRVHAYLEVNDNNQFLDVESAPGGAMNYLNNGADIQDVNNQIQWIKSDGINQKDSTYFNKTFINTFGVGSLIHKSTLKIFIAKAFPTICEQSNATVEQYKFILIITKQPE
jgi:hypothetical protein